MTADFVSVKLADAEVHAGSVSDPIDETTALDRNDDHGCS